MGGNHRVNTYGIGIDCDYSEKISKKKLLISVSAILTILLLGGCGGDDTRQADVAAETTATQQVESTAEETAPESTDVVTDEIETSEVTEAIFEIYEPIVCEEGYSSFEPKMFRLRQISDEVSADAVTDVSKDERSVTIKAILYNASDEGVLKKVTEDVTAEELDKSVIVLDASAVEEPGDYKLTIEVAAENEEPVTIESPVTISNDKYRRLYASTGDADAQYIDRILVNDDATMDEAELETLKDAYEKAGDVSTDDTLMMAAALYRETGDSKYRKSVEEYLQKIVDYYDEGREIDLSSRESLYGGVVIYLKTTKSVDYKLSEALMRIVFDEAIALTQLNVRDEMDRLFREDRDKAVEESIINANMLMLADSISMSVDYVRCAAMYAQYAGTDMNSDFVRYEMSVAEEKIVRR